MKEFVEKLIGRLEETRWTIIFDAQCIFENDKLDKCIEIVNELAEEYNNGEKKLCEITLNGCDDDTCFEMELTEQEYQFLLKVSEKANETSTYGCMPRMYVEKLMPYQPKGE